MYMVIFVVHDPGKLNELLQAWEEVGLSGATILPSTGLGRLRQRLGLRDDLPIMPSLRDFYPFEEETNRTLFTLVKDEAMVEQLRQAAERVLGPLEAPNTGIMVVLPVVRIYGVSFSDTSAS